jgi:DNA repair ATPase RecN
VLPDLEMSDKVVKVQVTDAAQEVDGIASLPYAGSIGPQGKDVVQFLWGSAFRARDTEWSSVAATASSGEMSR